MASFKDKNGRDWRISLDVGLVVRVKRTCQVNLAALFDKGPSPGEPSKDMQALLDPETLVNVVWELVEAEASKDSISAEGFAKLLLGDALEEIVDAIGEAVADFFQKRREPIRRVLAKTRQVAAVMRRRGEAALDKLDQTDPEALADQVEKHLLRTP